MKPTFAVCCILSAMVWWNGLTATIVALGLAVFASWAVLKWLGVGIVVLALSLPLSTHALDCLDTGDCVLADHPEVVEPQGIQIGCIGSDSEDCRWNTLDYTLQGIATGLQATDMTLTYRAVGTARFQESNAILGANTGKGQVVAYAVATVGLHLLGSAILPRPWRTIWQSVGIGATGNTMLAWVSFYN
jgi:hypothetical protein